VVTTDLNPRAFARAGRCRHSLACLGGAARLVPRLHERRKDIMPGATLLAERSAHGAQPQPRRSTSAFAAFAHRNAAELREAIEMARSFRTSR
jgi:hypothetical protein